MNRLIPVQVQGLNNIKNISACQNNSLALKNDGTVWNWGYNGIYYDNGINFPYQVSNLDICIDISAGFTSSIAVKYDGSIWSWGDNNILVGGMHSSFGNSPTQFVGLNSVQKIVPKFYYSFLALGNDTTLWSWGENWSGILGDGTLVSKYTPVQISINDVIEIVCGYASAVALKKDGTVWTWGCGGYGVLGNGTEDFGFFQTVPIQIQNFNNIAEIAAGRHFNLALKNDGTVWGWGQNYYGQLGDGTFINRLIPVQVQGLTNVISIYTGLSHSIAIKNDGTIWVWGLNDFGQLGDGTTINKNLPIQLQGF